MGTFVVADNSFPNTLPTAPHVRPAIGPSRSSPSVSTASGIIIGPRVMIRLGTLLLLQGCAMLCTSPTLQMGLVGRELLVFRTPLWLQIPVQGN
mmetsp:Transcript_121760/g.211458  ORF Transcript_121760/g.211458 Transcript_121760/m.211458 type:complete len:94 (+) Transcript_121760:380-661(+)